MARDEATGDANAENWSGSDQEHSNFGRKITRRGALRSTAVAVGVAGLGGFSTISSGKQANIKSQGSKDSLDRDKDSIDTDAIDNGLWSDEEGAHIATSLYGTKESTTGNAQLIVNFTSLIDHRIGRGYTQQARIKDTKLTIRAKDDNVWLSNAAYKLGEEDGSGLVDDLEMSFSLSLSYMGLGIGISVTDGSDEQDVAWDGKQTSVEPNVPVASASGTKDPDYEYETGWVDTTVVTSEQETTAEIEVEFTGNFELSRSSTDPIDPGKEILYEETLGYSHSAEIKFSDDDETDKWYDPYTNDEGWVETSGLQEATDDWRDDKITTDQLRTVTESWRNGEPIENLV